ncbi:MAG TPA: hypothetical protein VM734_03640 [Kofleriaceae bacterium]|jgi:hypothetical protein|nr:hypothetical protein [Kofleriaceae bacterium]
MTEPAPTIPPPSDERLDALVLARLATGKRPPAGAEVARDTQRFSPPSIAPPAWAAAIDASLGRLAAAGRIDGDRRALVDPWAPFALRAAPDWARLTARIVPALALGVEPGDARATAFLGDRDRCAAAVIARARGLWRAGAPPTPGGLADRVVWDGLALAGTAKRTPPEVRSLFLARWLGLAGGEAGPPERVLRLAAAREVGAARPEVRLLRDALVRRWLAGLPWGAATAAAPAPAPAPAPAITAAGAGLDAFAAAVRAAAQAEQHAVFGPRKVYIAGVWDALRGHPAVAGLDLGRFKGRLVEAHRAGLVSLARADLAGAMDPALMDSSETTSLDARYHFVVREEAP